MTRSRRPRPRPRPDLLPAGRERARRACRPDAEGAGRQTKAVTTEEWARLPRTTVTVDFHGEKRTYEGVEMLEALRLVGAPYGDTLTGKALADVAVATARDGYRVAYSIGEIDPGTSSRHVLIADKLAGKPLDPKDGPYQVVVEADSRPARSARMLERVELIRLPN